MSTTSRNGRASFKFVQYKKHNNNNKKTKKQNKLSFVLGWDGSWFSGLLCNKQPLDYNMLHAGTSLQELQTEIAVRVSDIGS